MIKYILKRILATIVVLFLVSFVVFMMMELIPGDPVYTILGPDAEVTEELYNSIQQEFGLDKPVLERYGLWLWNALHGDFGLSYIDRLPVTSKIAGRIGVSLYLALYSIVATAVIGVVLGVICAVNRGRLVDTVITLFCNVMNSAPSFWIGILLIYIFALKLQLLPAGGFTFPWKNLSLSLRQLFMPLFCMSIGSIAGVCRQTRSSMLENINQDYVRTARAKGLSKNRVIYVHALKNSLIPILTMLGGRISSLLGGTAFVETVFGIGGMGQRMVSAVNSSDAPVVMACVLIISAVGCVANLVVDILYGVVDPRIRLT